ncbi:MAG: hypothetical protein IJ529_01775 [Alphaproteobacteria bacterium]|nr:hypothetical protein [Alphaproteobacteria bacterium]
MNNIDFFKQQAKNLYKDFKNDTSIHFPQDAGFLVMEYGFDEKKFCLMNAQHIIAQMVGFNKWHDLANASEKELEVAKLLYDNQNYIDIMEWNDYLDMLRRDYNVELDAESKLQILKERWLNPEINQSADIDWYRELTPQEQAEENTASDDDNEIVECLHCGERFPMQEAKLVKIKEEYREQLMSDGETIVVCKNYPECDGESMDLIPVAMMEE